MMPVQRFLQVVQKNHVTVDSVGPSSFVFLPRHSGHAGALDMSLTSSCRLQWICHVDAAIDALLIASMPVRPLEDDNSSVRQLSLLRDGPSLTLWRNQSRPERLGRRSVPALERAMKRRRL